MSVNTAAIIGVSPQQLPPYVRVCAIQVLIAMWGIVVIIRILAYLPGLSTSSQMKIQHHEIVDPEYPFSEVWQQHNPASEQIR
jgi:hypothetical protein